MAAQIAWPYGVQNIPAYCLVDNTYQSAREAEVPNASFLDGANGGTSGGPAVGVNTGDYSPKVQDWPEIEIVDIAVAPLGWDSLWAGAPLAQRYVNNYVTGLDKFSFVQADAQTAPDGVLDATTGTVNETGKTVPAGVWCWGRDPFP